MKNRAATREALMQLIYQMSLLDDYGEELKRNFLKERFAYDAGSKQSFDRAYFDRVLEALRKHMPAINQLIETGSKRWKLSRIAKVDLAILRVAVAEILYCSDIPAAVSANEAVELAKHYSSGKSSGYINGVLGYVVREASDKNGRNAGDQNHGAGLPACKMPSGGKSSVSDGNKSLKGAK